MDLLLVILVHLFKGTLSATVAEWLRHLHAE